jgi:predicted acyltransferase
MNKRNLAIDMFRGLTMVLMVFVNDFWTVLNVPHGLEHFDTWEDGMGLSDIVFPMFLFAMGMSIPYALDRRIEKGAGIGAILGHILGRTLALLVMGAFIYNCESVEMAGNKGVYIVLMLLGFFLVWNQYPKDWKPARTLRCVGIGLLLGLMVTYRSVDGGLFRAGWWGILGQIGWMYLFCAIAYLLCRERPWPLALVWIGLFLVNLSVTPMRNGEPWIGENFFSDIAGVLQLGNGHSAIMALGGLLTVLAERSLRTAKAGIGMAAAAVLAVLATAAHQGWIISKNLGTLPWCLFVCALSIALYTLLRVLEKHGKTGWFKPFSPAGTATLTVYMIPYLFVALWIFINPTIPQWLTGWVGVGKCALYTAICLGIAWGLTKLGIKLKI